ncbi:SPRY-domain-containing protein [Rhizophagus irregularis]|uniref:SPRY-domain-containing protein n=2 Tax=Rhizophagus irregularis TaxID=588596 RepID=A0A2N0SJZ2_9GLOM|nr:hypothetical protein GLOIN_2v1606502 [Rhizophagus irregularis DAOM 181602=DAOM 197198]PKC75879.1 SPRY-domain-containing protein [Rhizophagus irregularis]POG71289.1 hypothetical protein GLOIN_2v1606502 [Rhizophagus irregularis DAOM 181602=DAOM 197198]|eukprot:XP_025178155.1 hypothetical protein GLOIN_2v1606502 [Rhizophagus irregularis DAOM 181602=DAOM 197198]
MNNIQINTKLNFCYSVFLLFFFINLLFSFSEAKGGGGSTGGAGTGFGSGSGSGVISSGNNNGGGDNNSEPFFKYVNGKRVCTSLCVAIFIILSFVVTTPTYESTNPAPDPTHEYGKKHEATNTSLRDAESFSNQYPPNENLPTPEEIENIVIQDGYKAWIFKPEDILTKRTSISNDGITVELYKRKLGSKYDDMMIQTNFPFFTPEIHNPEEEILHYFEITLLNKVSKDYTVAIGISTKPYPYFRLPGWNKHSVGYHSDDGRKFWNDEFGGRDYGPEWGKLGDVIGCGYKPKTGEVFFTKNGKFLGIAFAGLRHIWYPTIGSDGHVKMKINFGDEPFVYKEALGFGIGAPGKVKTNEK